MKKMTGGKVKSEGSGKVASASVKFPAAGDHRGYAEGSNTDSRGSGGVEDGYKKIKSYGSVNNLPQHVPMGRG